MFDVFTIILCYMFRETPPFADTSVKERFWQLLPHSGNCRILVLAQNWNFCSSKQSSEVLPQTARFTGFRCGFLVPHVRLDKVDIFTLLRCFWRCEEARRLAAASTCNDRILHGYLTVTLGQQPSHQYYLLFPGSTDTTLVLPMREIPTDTVMSEF